MGREREGDVDSQYQSRSVDLETYSKTEVSQ